MALVGVGILGADWTKGKHTADPGGLNHLFRKKLCGSSTRRGARLVPSSLEYQCVLPIKGGGWSLEVMV